MHRSLTLRGANARNADSDIRRSIIGLAASACGRSFFSIFVCAARMTRDLIVFSVRWSWCLRAQSAHVVVKMRRVVLSRSNSQHVSVFVLNCIIRLCIYLGYYFFSFCLGMWYDGYIVVVTPHV